MSSASPGRTELIGALLGALREASAQGVLLSQAVASRLGINPTDLECLDILARGGPMTAGQLAEATGLTTGAITGVVDRLELVGFARRTRDTVDRRRVIVELVCGVEARIAPLYASLEAGTIALCEQYSDAELAIVLDFMNRAFALSRDETAKLRDDGVRRD